MRNIFKNIRLLLAACLIAACTPSRTGVVGNTLTTNVKPAISITGMDPFTVQSHGKLWVEAATDTLTSSESVSFDYAFYADKPGSTDAGKYNRFAYAAIVRISHANAWRFSPPVDDDTAFGVSRETREGLLWMEQLLRTPSDKDWGSAVWRENGKETPPYWLAKRWTAHLNDSVRVVMEYREPWPEAMKSFAPVGGEAGEALQAFITRANAVFTIDRKRGEFPANDTAPAQTLVMPKERPDIPKLVGDIASINNSS